MYRTLTPAKERRRTRHVADHFQSENVLRVKRLLTGELENPAVADCLFFSTGVIDRIERQFNMGCTIVGDSNLVSLSVDRMLAERFPLRMECLIDAPEVISVAQQKRVTRAEVAMEQALQIAGPKLIVVGSAPMAIDRLLKLHHDAPLPDLALIATAAGFANAVELKERVWESGLPCIVARGNKGGVGVAAALLNALMRDAADRAGI